MFTVSTLETEFLVLFQAREVGGSIKPRVEAEG